MTLCRRHVQLMLVICIKEIYFLALGDQENQKFQYFFLLLNTMELMNA